MSSTNKSNQCRITVTPQALSSIRYLTKKHQLSDNDLITQLMEFYDLQHLDLLIELLKQKYDRGLTVVEINQLSVLFTLLKYIHQQVDLT